MCVVCIRTFVNAWLLRALGVPLQGRRVCAVVCLPHGAHTRGVTRPPHTGIVYVAASGRAQPELPGDYSEKDRESDQSTQGSPQGSPRDSLCGSRGQHGRLNLK